MSGPKTSRYTLTPEQRRILREQQQRERKIKTEKEYIRRYTSELRLLCAEIGEPLAKAEELNSRSGYGNDYISSVTETIQRVQETIVANVDVSGVAEPDVLEQQRKAIEECLKGARKQSVSFKEEAKQVERLLKSDLAVGIDKGFSLSFEQSEPATVTAPNDRRVLELAEMKKIW